MEETEPKAPPSNERCATCKFWNVFDKGTCRRNAPSPTTFSTIVQVWPITAPNEWCGEWVTKN